MKNWVCSVKIPRAHCRAISLVLWTATAGGLKRGLPRSAGHVAGAKTFKTIARYCNKIGLEYLTVYSFSTENWKRPKEEVDGIMNLCATI